MVVEGVNSGTIGVMASTVLLTFVVRMISVPGSMASTWVTAFRWNVPVLNRPLDPQAAFANGLHVGCGSHQGDVVPPRKQEPCTRCQWRRRQER